MLIMVLLMAASAAVAMTQIDDFIAEIEDMAAEAEEEALREQNAHTEASNLDGLDALLSDDDAENADPISLDPPVESDPDLAEAPSNDQADIADVNIGALLTSPLDDFFASRSSAAAQSEQTLAAADEAEDDDEDRTALVAQLSQAKYELSPFSLDF
ncbi:hypothetical protein EDD53_0882 [Pacificibacter maritimus]|uniref:Secreted protein n=1 Tax=Pacificibacter maritimus TaxID=762213 RepID=A0A3N4VFP5_9RHOB|nr:hypothetical protein [Pacificibacter maritimus]RPE71754.1 hypothetical protein EDD53_0882 [Pacificibacter maritimus]